MLAFILIPLVTAGLLEPVLGEPVAFHVLVSSTGILPAWLLAAGFSRRLDLLMLSWFSSSTWYQ